MVIAEFSPALSAPRHSLRSARVCLQMCPFCRKGTFLFNLRYFITSLQYRQLRTIKEPSSLSSQPESGAAIRNNSINFVRLQILNYSLAQCTQGSGHLDKYPKVLFSLAS